MAATASANATSTSNSRWWWKKSSNTKSKEVQSSIKSSVPSSLNGADEDASMFSLYSYGESLFAPSPVRNISSSIRAQHTKSEYSGISDVESTASIISKPWISRNIIAQESDQPLKQDEEANNSESDVDSFVSRSVSYPLTNNASSSAEILDYSKISMENLSSTAPMPSSTPRRRSSLVEYIVNKPLHGKLKAGFGRLVGNKNHNYSHNDSNQQQGGLSSSASSSEAAIRRRSFG
ncbi:uncharacterized protein ATC70_011194 [Mucor velutinosus]|uniref:Uncharacterized protein n=1 Tax=Mucor velutinosus TaxID=708070 RepID=A0AAN7DKC7_9FUNG|nr:hypothetical protein ATC70_011194 [Mucor velutinosus]